LVCFGDEKDSEKTIFKRPALEVAQDLLGKYLVRKIGNKEIALEINEVEAYDGPDDLANHASKGRTKRTETMFAEGGIYYIYLCYGMYFMLNIVTGEKDYPAAILIRGAGHLNGPGKLAKFLKIGKSLNGKVAEPKNSLWFENRGVMAPKKLVQKTSRVGVNYAGPVWAKKEYRFIQSEEYRGRQAADECGMNKGRGSGEREFPRGGRQRAVGERREPRGLIPKESKPD